MLNYNFTSNYSAIRKGAWISLVLATLLSACSGPVRQTDTDKRHKVPDHQEYDFVRGVIRTQLMWKKGGMAAQKALLDAVKAAGAGAIRLSLPRSGPKTVEEMTKHILYANKIGLKVDVILKVQAIRTLYPPGVGPRSGKGRFWNVYPISKIEMDVFNKWVQGLLTKWQKRMSN